jgi:hypothetical protein
MRRLRRKDARAGERFPFRSAGFHRVGKLHPWVSSRLEERHRWWRECWIGKRTDKDGDKARHGRCPGENGRAADRAKVKCSRYAGVGFPLERTAITLDSHGLGLEARPTAKGAAGSPLARQAVTHIDADRLAFGGQPKLTAGACSGTDGHAR